MLQTVKIGKADTNGSYGLLEILVPPGLGSPWHVHPEEDEWFYVLDGNLTFYVGDTRLDLTTGGFAFGPKGVPHTFIGAGPGPDARACRLRADAVRGIFAGSRSPRARARAASATGRTATRNREAGRNRQALRVHHPRPSGTAAGTVGRHSLVAVRT